MRSSKRGKLEAHRRGTRPFVDDLAKQQRRGAIVVIARASNFARRYRASLRMFGVPIAGKQFEEFSASALLPRLVISSAKLSICGPVALIVRVSTANALDVGGGAAASDSTAAKIANSAFTSSCLDHLAPTKAPSA